MKKAIGLACLLGLSGIGKGLAADLRGAAPVAQRQLVVPQLPSWAGLYVGVQAGHQSGGGDINVPATGEFHAVDPKSFIGGVMAGYAMQRGRVVGGLEGDINVLGGSALVDTGLAPDPAVTQLRTKMSWNGHLRGRLGYSFDQAMIFMAGGLALAGVENKAIGLDIGWRRRLPHRPRDDRPARISLRQLRHHDACGADRRQCRFRRTRAHARYPHASRRRQLAFLNAITTAKKGYHHAKISDSGRAARPRAHR
jgi:hypothetical protein